MALAAFVYRKHLVESIINSRVSFISSAHAQDPTAQFKKDFSQNLKIVDENASIHANPDVMGFELTGSVEKPAQNCEQALSPFYMTAFILADISNEDTFLMLNSCLRKSLKGMKWVINAGHIQVPITDDEKEVIESIQGELKKHDEILSLIDEKLLETDFSKVKSISKLTELVNKLEAVDSFSSRAARIFIYSGLGNMGKAQALMNEYLERSGASVYFEQEFFYKNKELRELVASMLGKAQKRFGRHKVFDAFLLKAYGEASSQSRELLDSEADISLGQSKVMAIIKSPTIGSKTPLAWAWWAAENLGTRKLEKILDTVPVSSSLEAMHILKFYLPASVERRKGFAKAFERLGESKEAAKRNLYLEILENESWKQFYIAKNEHVSQPLFKQKRDFFTTSFNQNNGILYSVFNLYELGDFQREHFLKVLAIRTYGLPSTQILSL